jgi:hypothetical protein
MAPRVPPMQYDGRLWWYTEWFDPAADLCCVCRQPIPEEDVPLILFKDVGRQTWQSRIHFHPCADQLFARGHLTLESDEKEHR